MTTLFTRIYVTVLLTLVFTTVGVVLALDQVNRQRFAVFAEERFEAARTLIELNWRSVPADNLQNSLAVLSRLTGTAWQPAPEGSQVSVSSHWWREEAEVTLPLGSEPRYWVQARISDWDELLTGTGYLLLNALSLAPVEERDWQLTRLVADMGLPARPVSMADEPLGFLQRRQLEQGQAVIRVESPPLVQSKQILYIPMGQGNALKLGPVVQFSWLTPLGLLVLIAAVLPAIGALIYLTLLPLKRRMARMIRAVDEIQIHPDTVNVPEKPGDELGTMGRHINHMAGRLVEYGRRSKELNQAVSHDLKTPLAQLKFAMELLKPSAEQGFMLDRMHQSVDDMEALVNELLLYHSLSHASADQKNEITDLNRLIPDVLDALDTPEEITLASNFPHPGPLTVAGEERLLRRLLVNVLGNALKYGRRQVKLEAHHSAGDPVQIVIEDDGPGIPPTERERVFEPFYRIDQTREANKRGHGLGLSISRDIVHLLGGSLRLGASDLGGCRVTLWLPYKD